MEWNHISNKETRFHLWPSYNVYSKRCTTPFFCASKRIIVFAWWSSIFNIEEKTNLNVKKYSCQIFFGTKFLTWKLKGQISIFSAFHFSTDIRRYSNIKQVFSIELINTKAKLLTRLKSSLSYMGYMIKFLYKSQHLQLNYTNISPNFVLLSVLSRRGRNSSNILNLKYQKEHWTAQDVFTYHPEATPCYTLIWNSISERAVQELALTSMVGILLKTDCCFSILSTTLNGTYSKCTFLAKPFLARAQVCLHTFCNCKRKNLLVKAKVH